MDFAGASLRIQPVGDDATIAALDKIDRRMQQSAETFDRLSSEEVNAAAAKYDQMYGNATAAMGKIEAAAYAMDAKMTASADAAAAAAEQRSARSTQSASRGLEIIARTGSVTGRSMDNILASVSSIALGFGPSGLLVGAISIAGTAIVDIFTRARKEIEQTQTEFNTRLVEMINAANVTGMAGTSGAMTQLYSGDAGARALFSGPAATNGDRDALKKLGVVAPSNLSDQGQAAYIARTQGIVGLTQLRDSLQATIDKLPKTTGYAADASGLTTYEAQLRDVVGVLKQMTDQYDKLKSVIAGVTQTRVDETKAAIADADFKKFEKASPWQQQADRYAALSDAAAEAMARTITLTPGAMGSKAGLTDAQDAAPQYTLDSTKLWQQELDERKQLAIQNGEDMNAIEVEFWKERVSEATAGSKAYLEALTQLTDAEARNPLSFSNSDTELGKQNDAAFTKLAASSQKIIDQMINAGAKSYDAGTKKLEEQVTQMSSAMANRIGNTIQSALEAAFAPHATIGSIFKDLTDSILEALGDMFEQIGEKSLVASTIMQTLSKALLAFDPPGAILASLALIAAGAAMKGLASRSMSASSGSSTVPISTAPVTGRSYITPSSVSNTVANPSAIGARSVVQPVFNIIGTNDARAARQIREMLDLHAKRS